MATAKRFQAGDRQAVRLTRDLRFEGTETEIEKRSQEGAPRLSSLAEVARFMHENFPEACNFPDREQPLSPQIRDLRLD